MIFMRKITRMEQRSYKRLRKRTCYIIPNLTIYDNIYT